MVSYTLKKKVYCVKQARSGLSSISDIGRNRRVPRRTIYRWIEKYASSGTEGLIDKKRGVESIIINPEFENQIVKLWQEKKIWKPKNVASHSKSRI
jgi:transposase